MHKKLIEVALPLDAINAASAREKSIRHGHPSTLHLWWARRPLATARAVLFASLVDDPSSHPEEFPTEEAQDKERQRLFRLIEKLVIWENSTDKELFAQAYEEIKKSTNGNPPPVFDPFAGGGAIPLEAHRLGLYAIASDVNPVAVMINKAMIELPVQFKNQPPINPKAKSLVDSTYTGAQGLAADIAYYGKLLKQKAFEKIGYLYPKVKIPETGQEATVIAWIWARTVKCPNPACGCEMPLVKSFWLSKKAGKEVYLEPLAENGKVRFEVRHGKGRVHEGTVGRTGATCVCCGANAPLTYLREEGKKEHIGTQLMSIVAENKNGRIYLPANDDHIKVTQIEKPQNYPNGELPNNPRWFSPPLYGIEDFYQLFTNRQLTALTVISDLISDVQKQIVIDGGTKEYSDTISVYLTFVVDKLADWQSTICSWNPSRDGLGHTFARQAIPMTWDYVEGNPFSNSSGCFSNMLDWIVHVVQDLPVREEGTVTLFDATTNYGLRDVMISTDPPYYDNIGYANLSDFFYVWLRRSLGEIYPNVICTILTPKLQELVADPYRFPLNFSNEKNQMKKVNNKQKKF